MPRFVVSEIVEETRFRQDFDRLLQAGPLVTALLAVKVQRMKDELLASHGTPVGVRPHPELNGSYVMEREGLHIRYFILPHRRRGWLNRRLAKLRTDPNTREVRIRLQGLDWPGIERL